MELVTTLNRRLMSRAFDLIFPERLRQSVCILVLGSEGRGEQILKTDQDNAVILLHAHEREAVQPLLQRLHQTFRIRLPAMPRRGYVYQCQLDAYSGGVGGEGMTL